MVRKIIMPVPRLTLFKKIEDDGGFGARLVKNITNARIIVRAFVRMYEIIDAFVPCLQNLPALIFSDYACLCASISKLILTSSPTRTPPVSSATFHVKP